jgi:hypothetical protein
MATSLRTNQLTFIFDGSFRKTNDYNGVATPFKHDWAIALANGTGSGYANFAWQDEYTIAASGNQVVDLRALTDDYGTAQVCTKVAVLAIRLNASSDTAATISVGNAASNGFTGICSSLTATIPIRYEGWVVWVCKDATKMATSATDRNVKILNNSSTQSVDVDVVVIGEI